MGVAIITAACLGASANAMRVPRIELLREVRVAGASVLLSDLLPEGARASLRTRAEGISLGAAPQPGQTRVLERSGVLESLGAMQDVAAEFAVPERVMVSRETRPITVQDVMAAIQGTLERGGIAKAAKLQPQDILFQTQVFVGPGDAGLQVLRAEFDPGLSRARFLLWASHDPQVLPFFVTARLTEDQPFAPFHLTATHGPIRTKPALPFIAAPLAKKEVLVTPGQRSTLVLYSDALRMYADVVPLERGSLGQQVRVRMLGTGKVFSAQVDGRAHLELKF
jgi:Chaperone for flagella basal body P-ring formation